MQHVDVKLTRYKMMMIRGQDRSIHTGSAIGEIKHMLGIYARLAVKSHLNVPAKAEFKGIRMLRHMCAALLGMCMCAAGQSRFLIFVFINEMYQDDTQ